MAASGGEHSDFEVGNYILNLLFFWKKNYITANINSEHCLRVLKKKNESYVVYVVI